MGRYTVIPQDTFDALQLDAGVLLKNFDVAAAANGEDGFTNADIICATTGGISASCVPTFSDLGEDIDNVPLNMKELKHLDSWECTVSTTSLGTSPELIRRSLGCADIDTGTGYKIIPRADLLQTDFADIWWVGDKANGGLVAIRIFNALATSGFAIQTSKNGKGQITLEIVGHVSIHAQKVVPMEFYSIDGNNTSNVPVNPITTGTTYTVTFNTQGGSTVDSQSVKEGEKATRPAVDPTLTGSTFDDWYTDDTFTTVFDFDTPITGDTTIYANWV